MDEKDTQSASIPLTSSASVNRNPKSAIRSFSESYNRSFNVRPHVNFQSTTTDNTTSERPPFVRAQSIRETVSNTARFFGVPLADSNNQQQSLSCNANLNTNEGSRWKLRRLRYMNRCYGGVNETARKELDLRDDLLDISPSQLATPLATPTPITPIGFFDITPTLRQQSLSRSGSIDSHVSRMLPPLERRDSVAKMAWDRFSSIVQKGSLRGGVRRHIPVSSVANSRCRSPSCSFSPYSLQQTAFRALYKDVKSTANNQGPTEVIPEVPIIEENIDENANVRSFESVNEQFDIRPENEERGDDGKQITRKESASRHSPSIDSIKDEVFFDVSPITPFKSSEALSTISKRHSPLVAKFTEKPEETTSQSEHQYSSTVSRSTYDTSTETFRQDAVSRRSGRLSRQKSFDFETPNEDVMRRNRIFVKDMDIIAKRRRISDRGQTDMRARKPLRESSILEHFNALLQARPRHLRSGPRRGHLFYGLLRKFIKPKSARRIDEKTMEQFDNFTDYRPFFTYWVTTAQVIVMIITIINYGVGPWGFDRVERDGDVLHSTVTLKRVRIYESANLWLGPKFSDLVHLGATFAPCMRRDARIYAQIENDRALERETGCCVYNDGSGCFQAGEDICPDVIASLVKWAVNGTGPNGRTSGAVCGQDPRYCVEPSSVDPYEWPDDITKWPQCHHSTTLIPENEKHLQCEITGRPCCIQLHGQCRITTRDYCDFVHGYFHENATLCSQVSCLGEICGMLKFMSVDWPDQFYRFITPLFLHAGIIHCAVTVLIQWCYMRDLEKLIGWIRIAIIYLGAGMGGNIASAIFLPYKPEVGPAGSHFGIFAAMYTDIIYNWRLLQRPWHVLRKLMMWTGVLFLIGLLPWIDNWAHLFGFIFGILLSLATFPYIQTSDNDRRWRIAIVLVSLATSSALFVLLLVVFYRLSDFECSFCEYFNCIPFTDHLCDNQGLNLQSWLPI